MVKTPLRSAILLLAATALMPPALAAEAPPRPAIAPAPGWVQSAEIPPAPDKVEGAAVVDLLLDSQTRLIEGGTESYRANVFRIDTAQGLDSAALQINWDPSLEMLTIHRYRVIRQGKVIDLLGDGSRVQVVRREKNLENATLDGELTASQQPEDLRVGDLVDLAYTLVRRDPATGGRAEALYGPQDGLPYGRYRLRVLWPKARSVHWRPSPGVIQPRLIEGPADNELIADVANVVTRRAPAGAPARYDLVNLVELTEFADWAEVSRRYATLFETAATIAPGSPLQAEIARIAAASPDPQRRAELALALVEEQVRYLFIGIDDGGFVPAPADQTWQRRYGDCKGKTALLIALLKGLGIAARPVLVNTENGDATAHRLPTMAGFDHVLVEASIGGKSFWLDGTRLGDTRLDRLEMPNYVVGLPATTTGSDLIALVPPPPSAPKSVVSLALDASAGVEVPAKAVAEMRFHGDEAASRRMKYAGLSAADLDRDLRKLWRDTYDFITPDTVSAKQEEPGGDFVITMHGRAKMDWALSGTSRWYELDRARVGWKIDITREGELNPDAPFAFSHPDWWANHETVILPQHGEGFTLQSKDVDRTVGGLYAFHRKVTLKDGVVTMDNDTRSLKAELPANEADSVRSAMQELAGEGVFIHLPESYLHTAADFQALADDKLALARAHMQNGAVLLDRNDAASAIAEETAALSLDDSMVTAHGVLALALARAGKDDARALAEADKVMAAKDTNDGQHWLAWSARGAVLLRQKDYAGSIAAYSQVIAANRNDLNALVGRGSAYLGKDQPAQALADFDAALAQAPELKIAGSRALALAGVGRREDALEAADQAIAHAPDDRGTRLLRATVREQTGDTAGALADIEYLLAHQPTAQDYLYHAALLPLTDTARREADIAAALKRDPKNAGAFMLRAQGALTTGQLDVAATALAQAEALKADSLTVTGLRLDLLAKRGETDAALRLAGETTAKHPGDAHALNVVCWFKATRNLALASALADCDAALKIAADTPAYLDSRGLVRLRGHDEKGAIADYSAALRRAPDLVSSLYGRGIAWARLGDRNRALADLSRARSTKPEIDVIWADYGVTPPAGF
jgi:tetratricopeptide (TPR) repeat protein/transglutaminase-like putative cysteine protease